jgi:DNA-binding transcriptional regulator GbsR (MarR family)
MANYTNMVKSNHDRSEAMLNLSLTTISEMVEDGEKVTVAELVRRTGFSRDYFYKNKDVHEALTNAITLQIGKVFINRKEESLLKATRRENELLKLKIISLEKNIETLTAELKKNNSSEFDLVNNL